MANQLTANPTCDAARLSWGVSWQETSPGVRRSYCTWNAFPLRYRDLGVRPAKTANGRAVAAGPFFEDEAPSPTGDNGAPVVGQPSPTVDNGGAKRGADIPVCR